MILLIRSGPNFAHVTTAQLSWLVQNCDLIWSLIFIWFSLWDHRSLVKWYPCRTRCCTRVMIYPSPHAAVVIFWLHASGYLTHNYCIRYVFWVVIMQPTIGSIYCCVVLWIRRILLINMNGNVWYYYVDVQLNFDHALVTDYVVTGNLFVYINCYLKIMSLKIMVPDLRCSLIESRIHLISLTNNSAMTPLPSGILAVFWSVSLLLPYMEHFL